MLNNNYLIVRILEVDESFLYEDTPTSLGMAMLDLSEPTLQSRGLVFSGQ